MDTAPLLAPLTLPSARPAEVRYIKLGAGGEWARRAFERSELYFGYGWIPHDLCAAHDWEAVAKQLKTRRSTPGKVSDSLREVRDFYLMGANCLWITFAEGHLWWAFAEPEVMWNASASDGGPPRTRRVLNGWHGTDIQGHPLRTDELSSVLTQVASYRQTICSVKAQTYLLQRINAESPPLIESARQVRGQMLRITEELIQGLHWADFETLVDLLFARGGWHRSSRLGSTMTDVDLILNHPLTGERAFVQVKSTATQAVLDDYLARARAGRFDRFFFVCHSTKGALSIPTSGREHLWVGSTLAEVTVSAGLFDWLVARSQ